MTDVCSKGHEILSSSKNSDKLSARLRDLTDAWQDLNDVARDRHILLQNSLQVSKSINYILIGYQLTVFILYQSFDDLMLDC